MDNLPKISGYIAENKEIIVFLYRRSHKISYLISLYYKNKKEVLEVGSLFYGKFYPNRCDISGDGKHFIYFVMGKSQKKYDKQLYCWTAICTPPKLTANMLFEYNDTWGGAGRFINDKRIFIDPGIDPEFDISQKKAFKKYKITFDGALENGGWDSGKGWTLIEQQIDPKYGDKYPIPKTWKKTVKGFSLLKTLEYESYLKLKNGNIQGVYDIHNYYLLNEKTNEKYSLNDNGICQWADVDNYGRIILSRGSNVFIYQNIESVLNNTPEKWFDLKKYIASPKNKKAKLI